MSAVPRARLLWIGFGASLAIVAAYLVVSAFEPFRTNWGDPWSDGNAMTSGRYFATEGFVKTAFTPILDVGPVEEDSLRYTHYPPLPDVIAGVVQCICGPDHLPIHRLIALVWSALALVFLFRYLAALFDRATAAIAVVVVATNLLFLQYADTIHHIPLYMMTGFGTLLAAVRWLDHRRGLALAAVVAGTFFCFLASYDYYFFLSIMLLATVRFRGGQLLRGHGRTLILVYGAAGVASIVVKSLLVIWAEGFEHWRQDIIFQFFERATSTHSHEYEDGVGEVISGRLWRFYTPVFFVALFAQVVAVLDRVRGLPSTLSMRPLAFLLAGVPFLLVFTQLLVEQYHPMLLLLPFAAVSIAVLVRYVWNNSRALAAALLALYAGWQVRQFALFDKGFLEPTDMAKVQELLPRDHHRFVMTNIAVDGPVRYLWNRHVFGIILDPMSLRDQFDMYGNDSPMTIAQLKDTPRHLLDKGVYWYFVAERRWSWISRPDANRKLIRRRFRGTDRMLEEALDGVGTVVYDSETMRVRTITEAQVRDLQRRKMPPEMPSFVDFGTDAGNAYKRRGVAGPQPGDATHAGFSILYARQPAKLVFTLKGYTYPAIAPLMATSELELPIPAQRPMHLRLWLSTDTESQTLAVRVNGRELGRAPLVKGQAPQQLDATIPLDLLRTDGLQTLEIETLTSHAGMYEFARIHKLDLSPE